MKYNLDKRKCDICGGTEFKDLVTQRPHSGCVMIRNDDGSFIHNENKMCMDCGLIMKPVTMTRESLKLFYINEYNKLYKGSNVDSISRHEVVDTAYNAIYVCDWLNKIGINLDGKKTLDIGSGDGMFVRALRGLGADAYGMEISKDAVKVCKKIHGFDTVTGDIMEGVVIPTHFDLVIIRNVLEHVYSAKEFLIRAMEIVSESGNLLIEVPSADRPYGGCPVDSFLSAAHIYTYTIDSFRRLADSCGLHIDRYSYDGHNSCMLILLKKGKANAMQSINHARTYSKIKEIYAEHDETFFNISKKIKELSEESYVNSIIKEINEYKHTSNLIVFTLVTFLFQNTGNRDTIAEILDSYKWKDDQSRDINCCEAGYEFFRGLMYVELGDFKTAKEIFKKASSMYPQIMEYNFIKELRLDGVLSDTVLNESMWFNCLRHNKSLG